MWFGFQPESLAIFSRTAFMTSETFVPPPPQCVSRCAKPSVDSPLALLAGWTLVSKGMTSDPGF